MVQASSGSIEKPLSRRGVLPGWVHDHDDRWIWTAFYVGGAVVLSIWISLFWLVVLVMLHGLMEWLRHRLVDREVVGVAVRVCWELKLDIALVLFAFVVALYMDLILGAAGLGGAARVGAQAASRAGAWARAIRGVLLTVDDVAQVARVLASRGKSKDDGDGPPIGYWGGWTQPWGIGGRVSVGLGVVSLALILLAPLLTDQPPGEVFWTILGELHPWPPAEELAASVSES
jgi:hypothetical protein